MTAELQRVIDAAWEARDGLGPATRGEVREAVEAALAPARRRRGARRREGRGRAGPSTSG